MCCSHIETSQLICCPNQLIGFYVKATLALNGLKKTSANIYPTFFISKNNPQWLPYDENIKR